MDLEQIFVLATARGVQLDASTLGAAATDGEDWSFAELAEVCRGLESRAWFSALYTLAGDDSVKPIIAEWLTRALEMDREANRWAGKCERITGERTAFDEELVWLFLIEERNPALFRIAPELRAIALRVQHDVWRRTLSHQYQSIYATYTDARLRAEEHVRRRLKPE